MGASGSKEETFIEHAKCYLTITLIIRSTIYKISGLPSLTKTSNMDLLVHLNDCCGTRECNQGCSTLSTLLKLTQNTVQRLRRCCLITTEV
ncbi:hypothetical protein QQF64_014111 [Cirrhinus molitorella]|uniref:Uncharacterized protein n=1 Tax=Cirrhinus molitorella TaxID=172907 RepID=A0ABR3LU99_9TELE